MHLRLGFSAISLVGVLFLFYLNYLLSNEGQVVWSKASALASLRRDVPRDHIPEILLPQESVSYQETYRKKYVLMRREIADFINTVLQR